MPLMLLMPQLLPMLVLLPCQPPLRLQLLLLLLLLLPLMMMLIMQSVDQHVLRLLAPQGGLSLMGPPSQNLTHHPRRLITINIIMGQQWCSRTGRGFGSSWCQTRGRRLMPSTT